MQGLVVCVSHPADAVHTLLGGCGAMAPLLRKGAQWWRGMEHTLSRSCSMCDVLCTFQTNLMQSPQSSVQDLKSFMCFLWCMTNPCIIFSGKCCRAARPRRGRMGTGCCITYSELSSAGSLCWCSQCSGWNRHIVLAWILVKASVRIP